MQESVSYTHLDVYKRQTYGSYTKDEVSIVKSVNQIEIFDTGIAILAGMMRCV